VAALVAGDRNCVLEPQPVVRSAATAPIEIVRTRARCPKSVSELSDSERLDDFDASNCRVRREFVLMAESPRTADETQVVK
jgi:hypothetical protein